MKHIELLNNLLRSKKEFIDRCLEEGLTRKELRKLSETGLVFFMIYGFIIGLNHSWLQAAASAIKLPILFSLTILICLPTLYLFLSVLGAKQNIKQLFSFIIVCLVIMSIVLVAFAPISLFFLITTHGYFFFKLTNVGIFGITGIVGLYFFSKNLHSKLFLIESNTNKKRAMVFLKLWLVMFAIIGSQLSYSISPFFGYQDKPFILLTNSKRNFFIDVADSFHQLMTPQPSQTNPRK